MKKINGGSTRLVRSWTGREKNKSEPFFELTGGIGG
jgi:hypothetical protein